MLADLWPLAGLAVRTPRLELRYIDDDLAVALAHLAAAGVHDPAVMPFSYPWTDVPSPQLERNVLQFQWRCRAEWQAEKWWLGLAVVVHGHVVGAQDVQAEHFGRLRQVTTGSWLGRAHQGQGIGTEMRAAVLHLAFDGLGALGAHTAAYADNAASLGVTRALGYRPNGERAALQRDVPGRQLAFHLDRAAWLDRRRDDIEIVGLDGCRELFGVPPTEPPPSV